MNRYLPFVLTGVLFSSSGAMALQVEPGVGVGLEYTDNAALTPDNEDSDLIATGYLGARIEQESGPVHGSAVTSLAYHRYTEDTFSDKHYFRLGANADWDMIRHRLVWRVQDYFTQQSVNSLNADTPSNTQNTNVFTVGPDIYFPLSLRHSLALKPVYRNFYYEVSDTDNQQYGLTASWTYRMYRTLDVGLDGGVTRVEYDKEQRYPSYTSRNVHLVLSGTRVHSDYQLNLGATSIDRERSDDFQGFTGNLTWRRSITGRSSIRIYGASELTDTSTNLLNTSARPEDGDFSNEQISGDVLRASTVRLAYARQGAQGDASLWGQLRKLDYKESQQDRDIRAVGVNLNHRISPLLTGGVYGSYDHIKETDISRTDKDYILGGNLSYHLSRKLRSVLDVRYQQRDSTLDTQEYNELSALISLVYGYGDVPRASRSRGY